MDDLSLPDFLPLAVALAVTIVVLGLAHFLLLARHKDLGSEARLPRQLVLLALTVSAVVLLVSVSPLPESTRNHARSCR